jgi:hypothetical protein
METNDNSTKLNYNLTLKQLYKQKNNDSKIYNF